MTEEQETRNFCNIEEEKMPRPEGGTHPKEDAAAGKDDRQED